jgi:hypothetical protein
VPATELTDEFEFEIRLVAAIFEWIKDDHKPPNAPKRGPLEWKARAEEARQAALNLAGVIKAREAKAAFLALQRMDVACINCHDIFRQ